MFLFSAASLFTGFCQKFSFGVIGENVAYNIRKKLYRKILEKHQGFFDHQANAPSILTSTLSSDAQLINGMSTEGLGSILESICAIMVGIILGFVFSWRMAIVCICISPFMALTGYMGAKRSQGLSSDIDQSQSDANLLAGDAIMNYRTVISFAHDEKIVDDYQSLLMGPQKLVIKQAHITGIIYGLSQFLIYGSMASLFYAGALLLNEYKEEPINMFICIFAMNFGALASGQANQFGPDVGKARSAAGRIFNVIEHPTEITAMHKNGKR